MKNGADEAATPRVVMTWDAAGALHVVIDGGVTHDHLIVGAYHLQRTAGSIIDALAVHQPQRPALVRAASMEGI